MSQSLSFKPLAATALWVYRARPAVVFQRLLLLVLLGAPLWAMHHAQAQNTQGSVPGLRSGATALPPAPAGATLSAPAAQQALQQQRLTLVDIRRPQEWADTGVAQGALRLDMQHPQGPEGFMAQLLKQVGGNKDAPLALICRTGNRTAQVQRYLQAHGFTQVYHVAEGMAGSAAGPGWVRRGLPIDKP